MLSTLFYMQAIGALIGNAVSVLAIIIVKHHLPLTGTVCNELCKATVDTSWRWIVGLGTIPPLLATVIRWWVPESPRYTMEVEKNPARATEDVQKYFTPQQGLLLGSPRSGPQLEPTLVGTPNQSLRRRSSGTEPTFVFGERMELNELTLTEPAVPLPVPSKPTLRKETWREFAVSFWTFLRTNGNWTDLAGTSLSWLLLDFAYYFLSVNNPTILNKLWNTQGIPLPTYQQLVQNGCRALIAVSAGSVVGGGIFIAMARFRWQLQYYGFMMLGAAFVVVGVCFVVLLNTRYFAAVIVLYALCSLFFDLGPNTSTYVVRILFFAMML
jgi:PHS family inorganic phosphate transporter-like MFS transporter